MVHSVHVPELRYTAAAVLFGFMAGTLCNFATQLKFLLKYDDCLDVCITLYPFKAFSLTLYLFSLSIHLFSFSFHLFFYSIQ
jgi:hypothetical protein